MIAESVSAAAGCLAGATVAAGIVTRRRQSRSTESGLTLNESGYAAIEDEFRVHAAASQRQVSEYGDLLAGGDVALRDRLRRFEGGVCP
jgi:hypothetical protein